MRSVVTSNTGFTLDDILNNDFDTVLAVINAKAENVGNQVEEVMSLGNFVETF